MNGKEEAWCSVHAIAWQVVLPSRWYTTVLLLIVQGAKTLAFIVDNFVQGWAQHTETLLVDSTCEYNLNYYILSTD